MDEFDSLKQTIALYTITEPRKVSRYFRSHFPEHLCGSEYASPTSP